MVDTDRLNELLRNFARTLVTDYSIEDMLDSLCREIVVILDCDGAGVMLEDESGDLRFVAASDDVVRSIEALQIELGEGPCLMAYRSGEVILADDLDVDQQFPQFAKRARAAGMAAVQSFPLRADDECVGALNMYADHTAPFDDAEIETAKLLADVCTTYILNARTLADSYKLAGQLQKALDSRVVIEQAKGKLAEQLRVSVGDAFGVLRSHARNNGLKLHDVATAVVNGELHLSASD